MIAFACGYNTIFITEYQMHFFMILSVHLKERRIII